MEANVAAQKLSFADKILGACQTSRLHCSDFLANAESAIGVHHRLVDIEFHKHLFRNPAALAVRIEKALPLGAYCLT